ncbi:hypothetical protein ACFXDH_18090 [Streptomyces sp. NPDC059467]
MDDLAQQLLSIAQEDIQGVGRDRPGSPQTTGRPS